MLLQVSVLLFSAGVTMVAYKLSAALAWVLVALNVVAWAVWWGSDLFPLFSPTCPFKSSLSRVIFYAAFRIRRSVDKRFALMKNWKIGKFPTLEARELDEMRRQQGKLELEALDFANREFWGSKQLKGINELFKQASNKEEALDCILHILDADGGLDLDTVQFQAEVIGTTQDEGVKQLMEIGRQIYGELIRSPENEDDWQSRVKILQARYQMFLGVPRSSGEGHGEGVSAVMSGQSRRNAHQSRALEGRDSRLEDYEPLYQC